MSSPGPCWPAACSSRTLRAAVSPRLRPRASFADRDVRALLGPASLIRVGRLQSWLSALAISICACERSSDAGGQHAGASTSDSTTGEPPACEGEGWSDGSAEDTGLGMGDDMPLPLTIEALQRGDASNGTVVALTGVIVVSPSAPSEVLSGRELFVQDPAGGAWSGLRVVATAFDLVPGDVVDLVGDVATQGGFVALQVRRTADMVRTGSAGLPAATQVEIEDIAPMAASARQYEGVVVEVVDATVTDADPCMGEVVLDDLVRVDDRFMPGQLDGMQDGDTLSAVRGVFVSASGSYELAPPDPSAVR